MKRRKLLALTGTGLIASGTYGYLSVKNAQEQYEKLVAKTWSHPLIVADQLGLSMEAMKELVRCGTLAANSHNTQAWKFHIGSHFIEIQPDFSRRCPAVDPDDHHLFASMGCAVENIFVAAEAYGLNAEVGEISSDNRINIKMDPAVESTSDLFLAIPNRQCTRSVYMDEKIPREQLETLKNVAECYGVNTQIFTDNQALDQIIEYVIKGNTIQMNDEAFVKELKQWIRFNKSMALELKDGLFSASSGSPEVPSWLGNLIFDMVFKVNTENKKYRKQISSSAAVMAFMATTDNKQGWINVGRSYQRTALQATSLGIKHAFINQATEVPEVRTELADFLSLKDKRPDLLIRLGYADDMPKSLRRPLEQVIV